MNSRTSIKLNYPANKFLYCLLFLAITWQGFAQSGTGTIRGTVSTVNGEPASFVNITLKGTTRGSTTGSQGSFEISRVLPGDYVIVASLIGLETKEQRIQVEVGETVTVNFVLEENTEELQEVIVSADANLNKEDQFTARIPLKKLENPQVYNTVSSEILKQQAVTHYDEALRNVPGLSRTWESTGRDGDGAAFFALRGLESQAALINGLPGITNGNLDPANVEEVQVLKGPSATLFGANATSYSSYGGLINTITKKPYEGFGGEIAYQLGSFGLNRVTADINAPLSKEEKIALRVNTAFHNEGSFQDAGFKKSFFFAPTLSYEVNDRLSFLVVTEILEEERAVAPVFFHSNRVDPLTFTTVDELGLDTELSFTTNDLSIKNPRTNVQAQMNYRLSDAWTSQTVVSRGTARSDGYYTYIWPDIEGDNDFGQYFTYVKESRVTTDIQQNFNGDFKIGNLRNRLLLGFDYFHRTSVNNGLGYVFIRNVSPQGEVNFTDPYTGEELPPAYLSRASIDNLLADTEPGDSNVANGAYSLYVSDVLNVTPQLSVLASLRVDYFDSKGEKTVEEDDFDQFAFSPKFGAVYQLLPDKLSVFGNYQNGFYNIASIQIADPDGSNPRVKSFEPEQGNQWEAGVKAHLLQEQLFFTASYYDIRIKNRVIGDVTNIYNYLQGGEVGSKGFEFDLTANPYPGFHLIAGYSHNKTENLEGNEGDFYGEPGRAPGGQGPQDQVNFWATYTPDNGPLRNFGLGLGGNYAGKYRVIDGSGTGEFDLPAYTVLNTSLFYNSDRYRLALNVNNLTDTEYYIGYWSVNPQKPVQFIATFAYKF
jgi:iron complex outermembrane receptor protein